MRISERLRYDMTNERVDRAKAGNSAMMEQISSLKKINRLSDDPTGAARVLRGRDRLKALEQFQKNAEYSKGYMERSETALSGIHDSLIRAKELSVAMANSTYGPESREAASREVRELLNTVVSLANTRFAGRYVFSGFRTQTPALSSDGRFLGDDGAIFLPIEDGENQKINIQARYLFEPTHTERGQSRAGMIDTLDTLYVGLVENDSQLITHAMSELDHQLDKASTYQATIGSMYGAVEGMIKRLELDSEHTLDTVSKIEDVDMFRASSDFKRTETVLQSTLLAANKLLQPSLLNFMQ